MSIVNEALKKAAKAKDRKEKQKKPRQDQWMLTLTSWNWKRPVFYGAVTAIAFVMVITFWVGLQRQEIPINQKGLTLAGGKIYTPNASLTSIPKPSRAESQTPSISDHYLRGLTHYREKRYKEAEQEFLAILTQDPNQAVAHNNLGLIYHSQGRSQKAVLEYLAALRIDPNLSETLNNLALLYDQQGRADEAMSLYDRALKIKPDYSEAHLNYAVILERLGYLEEARGHYQRFLFQPPSDLGDVVVSVQARFPNLP
jgi:tetratricopeptide (TPR) repeat protein